MTGEDTMTTTEAAKVPREITLGEHTIRLAPPKSLAIRGDVLSASIANESRANGAALALCWQGRGRPRISYAGCGHNPMVFGGRVIDDLMERGIDYWAIQAAGMLALSLCAEGMVSAEEVASAEAGFQGPEGD